MVITEWPQLKDVDWATVRNTMRNPLIFDGRNLLEPSAHRWAVSRRFFGQVPGGGGRSRRSVGGLRIGGVRGAQEPAGEGVAV
ncbi:hypothetical protein [Actinopolymorpha rutila]|uniref:UDP-glucose 6-dehydrogenase n=1 Tax=Actinopolymorpha rutila TaxID=446787 RepID=A0A852ZE63_9ACTN|nr:hypothetical protein [Actinopolymorpha rutila]